MKTLIMIPTYNEADNVEFLYRELTNLHSSVDFLFVDDNSPDGTGDIINNFAGESDNVFLLRRPAKKGVGSAHKHGITWAYQNDYQILLTMDCDFTHSPSKVRDFLSTSVEYDIAVGSRFIRSGSLEGWSWHRKLLTHAAHLMTFIVLGMPYDASGAFRLYRLDRIPIECFQAVRDEGYSFFWESLLILWKNNFSIREIPIDLPARTYGTSKMKLRDVVRGMQHLIITFFRLKLKHASILIVHPNTNVASSPSEKHTPNSDRADST